MAEITPLLDDNGSARHRSVPPAIAYPADYGLANAASSLIHQYGTDGAINRLIEMAERLAAGEDAHTWVLRRRRVMPACYREAGDAEAQEGGT